MILKRKLASVLSTYLVFLMGFGAGIFVMACVDFCFEHWYAQSKLVQILDKMEGNDEK